MASYNKVMMIGRLVRDPELRYLPNGNPKGEFRLASTTKSRQRRGTTHATLYENTCYIDVIVWGRQAEVCKQYLSKGRQVLVEGRLDFQQWGKDGKKRSKHQIVADKVEFLDGPTNAYGETAEEVEDARSREA